MHEHYRGRGIQALDVIREFGLGFSLGNVVKYILRHNRKEGQGQEDIYKAIWYLVYYLVDDVKVCDVFCDNLKKIEEKRNNETE